MKLWLFVAFAFLSFPAMPQTGEKTFRSFVAMRKDQYWTESRRYAEKWITFSRAADGSNALVFDAVAPDDHQERPGFRSSFVFNASRRWYVHTEALTHTAVVMPIVDDREMDRLASIYGACESLRDGTWKAFGRSTMLGFEVVEVEVEKTDRSRTKEWVAPDLQCYALKHTYEEDGELRTKLEVVSIELKEPDHTVFEAGSGYAMVSPLEMEERYRATFPGHDLFGLNAYTLEEQYQLAVAASKKRK